MKEYFADSYYFLAYLNPADQGNAAVRILTKGVGGRLVTTDWILIEVADAMCVPPNRVLFLELLDSLRADPHVEIIRAGPDLFDEGVALFARRPDKAWSLTDCISFVVMTRRGIVDALTGDRHFTQAGFRAMLGPP